MKQLLLTFLTALCAFVSNSQIETTIIDGKTYFVYPYQEEVTSRERYYTQYADKKEILIRDDQNRKVVSVEYEDIEHTPAQIKNAKKASKTFIEQLEKNPVMMYDEKMSLMKDITPALEKLPDGNYVQYYRDVPYIKDRVIRYRNDIVAGYFTIKNNQLEGSATWYYVNGKKIKTGSYLLGSKQGLWSFYEYEENYEQYYADKQTAALKKESTIAVKMVYDTLTEKMEFRNGIRNGKYCMLSNSDTLTSGYYADNKESGSWRKFEYKTEKTLGNDNKYYVRTTDQLFLRTKYTVNPNGESRAKSVVIRSNPIANDYRYSSYDMNYMSNTRIEYYFRDTSMKYSSSNNFPDFTSFMTFAIQKEELDLPEEEYHSFEGAEEEGYYGYYDGEYGGDYGYGGYEGYGYGYDDEEGDSKEEEYSEDDIFKYLDGKRFLINKLIDSLGYHYNYEGEFANYHTNGQLMYRIFVKDGKIVEESPVYFDNGQIANQITFLPDSNIYVQEFYDYYGKLYHTSRHDSTGRGIVVKKEVFDNTVLIRDKKYNINWGQPTLDFSEYKKLKKGIESRELVFEKIWKEDSTIAAQGFFDPESRVYNYSETSLSKKPYLTEKATFDEEYKSVTAELNLTYKNIQLDVLSSGTYEIWGRFMGSPKADSTVSPQTRVLSWRYLYEYDSDHTILVNGKPFNGKIYAESGTKKYALSASDKAIKYCIPTTKADQKAFYKTMKQYHKGKTSELLDAYVPEFGGHGKITQTPLSLLYGLYEIKNDYGSGAYSLDNAFYELSEERGYDDMYYGDYDMEGYYNLSKAAKKRSKSTAVTGQYSNGKEEGVWLVKDQYGKTLRESHFINGELSGDYKLFAVEYPLEKPNFKQKRRSRKNEFYDYGGYSEEDYYRNRIPEEYRDAKPKKKTYYLNSLAHYSNGYINGTKVTLNWMGDTTSLETYLDGVQQGISYQRNKLFYSESYYENGVQDGITKTWLTPINKDSVLLFELNFQNGALQGESVAYHNNGRIAKKGFFLSGQPIDDYEAFDTLGVRYQYVKFQFNQPIEEKIWEENQLSVRYEFKWEDSVYFNVKDITNSSSIDRLINSIGFDDGSMRSPYYGRPSVLDKTGVDYKMTKYYPNDTIARTGQIVKGKKTGIWNYYNYDGLKLMTVDYFDSILQVNDTLKFKSKGILTYVDAKGKELSKSWIIEKFEKYDCAHTDHNEERMLYCFWQVDTNQHRIDGYTKNYYDNGSIQNEGMVKNGLPVGVWKMYDVDGHLSQVGTYNNGKRDGRWLSGDLGDVKNMSEICLNPNLQNLDEILNYQEKLLDISVIYYTNGKEIRREYYGINKNNGKAPEGYGGDDEMYYRY